MTPIESDEELKQISQRLVRETVGPQDKNTPPAIVYYQISPGHYGNVLDCEKLHADTTNRATQPPLAQHTDPYPAHIHTTTRTTWRARLPHWLACDDGNEWQ